jgi:competence protein ComEA
MLRQWLERYKVVIVVSLIVLIIIGGVLLYQKHPWSKEPLEIVLTSPTPVLEPEAEIFVAGAVMWPGWYPLENDSLEGAIMTAGGATSIADLSRVKLYVYESDASFESQKIDINRAGAWLLEALPGVGSTLAQRIVDYRNQNGPFDRVEDLMKVEGIGQAKYDGLQDLITVE